MPFFWLPIYLLGQPLGVMSDKGFERCGDILLLTAVQA
jgi:hypothetical protein